ncbi:MAG: hypothetical protein R3Y50_00285 [Rikenellaceae bacterium]
MKRYFFRAVRYLLYVVVIFILIFSVMNLMGQSEVTIDMLPSFFASSRALIMGMIMVVLIAIHPILSYTKRPLGVDFNSGRDHVLAILAEYDYQIKSETESEVVLQQKTAWRRILSPNDDTITIDKKSFPTMIEGNRKALVRVLIRVKP